MLRLIRALQLDVDRIHFRFNPNTAPSHHPPTPNYESRFTVSSTVAPFCRAAELGSGPVRQERALVGAKLRNIANLSFWSQLALTVVAGVILLFSVSTAQVKNVP